MCVKIIFQLCFYTYNEDKILTVKVKLIKTSKWVGLITEFLGIFSLLSDSGGQTLVRLPKLGYQAILVRPAVQLTCCLFRRK